MIKKALSIFMAFSCFFSAGAPVFADGDDEVLPIQYHSKPKISTKKSVSNSLALKRKIIQKAFLIGLLLAKGANIEIAFRKKYKNLLSLDNFIVQKINNVNVDVPKASNNQVNEIIAILNALKNEDFKFEFNNKKKRLTIISAKINNYFLNQNTMCKMGEKILELILDKRTSTNAYGLINLNDDIKLRDNILNIFSDLLEPNTTKSENTLEFFELPSDSKKMEPITNPAHVDYLKQHPDTASHALVCYQKMFFSGLLSAIGSKVTAKEKETLDDIFPECITFQNVNDRRIKTKEDYYGFLVNVIKHINSSFPPEKIKIETLPLSYSTPAKVTINNKIILNENDIFNLGQRFYNLIHEIILKCPYELFLYHDKYIHLSKSPKFTQGVKEIFKDYTGQDLPDLK